jgi:hypothetical protein
VPAKEQRGTRRLLFLFPVYLRKKVPVLGLFFAFTMFFYSNPKNAMQETYICGLKMIVAEQRMKQ